MMILADRVFDWFYIGVRFEYLLIDLRGLRGVNEDSLVNFWIRADGAK
jgi:hypothetical protein